MKNILFDSIKNTISTWGEPDIYAISLFVYNDNDNPSKPTVTLRYNTEANVKSEIDDGEEEQEARWNYALWPQNEELVFGVDETENIVKQWVIDSGFTYYTDKEIKKLFKSEIDLDDEPYTYVTTAFIAILIEIVRELHSSGFIKEQFGNDIPILIHELEYYDEIADQNIEANGSELVEEFVKFCKG